MKIDIAYPKDLCEETSYGGDGEGGGVMVVVVVSVNQLKLWGVGSTLSGICLRFKFACLYILRKVYFA